VNAARWIQPLGVRSRVRPGCAQHRVFAIVPAPLANHAYYPRRVATRGAPCWCAPCWC
jgi:hypothetical protein